MIIEYPSILDGDIVSWLPNFYFIIDLNDEVLKIIFESAELYFWILIKYSAPKCQTCYPNEVSLD